jgi:uncharacterized protein YjeT (DUF2065 family)
MWTDLISAVGLMLVIEGIFPFLNPRGLRQTMLMISQIDDRLLRVAGLGSMIIGLLILYAIR